MEDMKLWPTHEPEDLAWAAGFFDGEGCTSYHASRKQKFYPRLRVVQCGEFGELLLRRFQRSVQMGKVYGPYKPIKDYYLPRWIFQVSGPQVREVLRLLWPWLSEVKKRQALKVLNGE